MILNDNIFEELNKLKEFLSDNKDYGTEKSFPEKEFIKNLSILNPQSYGSRIERRVKNKLGEACKKIKSSENRGDLYFEDKFIEVKSSIITKQNNFLNLVQIRLYQDLDYYLCCAFDLRELNDYKSYLFLLTHDEMIEEMKKVSSTNAHGTLESLENNENIELRYSLLIDETNDVFKRWTNKYKKDNYDDIIKKIKEK